MDVHEDSMIPDTAPSTQSRTAGRLIHFAAGYDLLVWFLLRGRERAFRERLLDLARAAPGEAALDIGCGTGTLAIAARRRVGASGTVHGIDASPEMISRARHKAEKAGLDVVFETATAQSLPFGNANFDLVLSTLMLHHLPRIAREQCAAEIRRVLKPGGRVLAVDIGRPKKRRGLLGHLHRHGHVELVDLIDLLRNSGLRVVESGPVGVLNLQFVLAANETT